MRRTLFYIFAVVALVFTACDEEDKENKGNENDPAGVNVAGVWNLRLERGTDQWILTDNSKFTITELMTKREGNYKVSGQTLTLTATKAWERDYVRNEMSSPVLDEKGQYQYTDWNETDVNTTPSVYKVKMLYEGDAMILEQTRDDEVADIPFVKDGASKLPDIQAIQGKWYWKMYNNPQVARAVVIINGNIGEVIITPYGERYTGTIRYENGLVYLENPTFYTTRYNDPQEPEIWDHINAQRPEDSPWRIPQGQGSYGANSYEYLIFPFIVEGNKAYATMANLMSVFEKQSSENIVLDETTLAGTWEGGIEHDFGQGYARKYRITFSGNNFTMWQMHQVAKMVNGEYTEVVNVGNKYSGTWESSGSTLKFTAQKAYASYFISNMSPLEYTYYNYNAETMESDPWYETPEILVSTIEIQDWAVNMLTSSSLTVKINMDTFILDKKP